MTKDRLEPEHLGALVRASGVKLPKHVEYNLEHEHFLIEGGCETISATPSPATPAPATPAPASGNGLRAWLRNYRKNKRISVTDLASEIGIKRHTLQGFLTGKASTQPRTIQKISDFKAGA